MTNGLAGGRGAVQVGSVRQVAGVVAAVLLGTGVLVLLLRGHAEPLATSPGPVAVGAPCPLGLLDRAARHITASASGQGVDPTPGSTGLADVQALPSPLLASLGHLTPHAGGIIDVPGTTLDRVDISERVTIAADNVHIVNSSIHVHDYYGVLVMPGVRGAVVDHVVIDGSGRAGLEGSAGVAGPITVTDSDIFAVENGAIPGSSTRITRTCIRDLAAPGDPHYDGIQMDGGQADVRITANVIDVSSVVSTSAVMLDSEFGPLTDIEISGNVLIGGTYTVYLDGRKGTDGAIGASVSVLGNSLSGGRYAAVLCARTQARVAGNAGPMGPATTLGCGS